ncbi:hypothetical protein RND81_02G204100 [Saponaria officinalis]|uniref:Peroxidase n=1 Tax=Saponaria officinalis TaxID=3572 RepID=A0AAW1MN02_SAPOF
MVSTPKNVIITAVLLQLVLLLSNVNESRGWFLGLPPIFGFPPSPQQPPSPSLPPKNPRPSGLKVGFYLGLCPVDIEASIKVLIQDAFSKDSTILPAFLRMQFHDCFVNGCDASILIDGESSEKKADANLSVRGYELIDTLKAFAEAQCPGVVSCADLIAIITTEVLRLGGGPEYAVQTGRCDGLKSDVNDVDLPGPSISAQQSIAIFGAKKFTPQEMVALLGCHTVGITHCMFFEDRLYPGTGDMDPTLRNQLITVCPKDMNSNNFTNLDQNPPSSNKVDNSFFDQINKKRGVLHIDQDLASNSLTKRFVTQFAQNQVLSNSILASSMLKLQALDVLTGNQGEIRQNCRIFNNQ